MQPKVESTTADDDPGTTTTVIKDHARGPAVNCHLDHLFSAAQAAQAWETLVPNCSRIHAVWRAAMVQRCPALARSLPVRGACP